jgi:flagellar biogenesis protein FliO
VIAGWLVFAGFSTLIVLAACWVVRRLEDVFGAGGSGE